MLLMRILEHHANRRVCFLIAEKSIKESYIGAMAARMGPLPVVRAMDDVKPAEGKSICLIQRSTPLSFTVRELTSPARLHGR